MKTIKFLAILCFLFEFNPKSLEAQIVQKENYQEISGITSISISYFDTPKLATVSLKPAYSASGQKYQPKKKTKPYVSNKSKAYDSWWYRFLGTSFNVYKYSNYRIPNTETTINNSRYPVNTTPRR